jgi:multidrug efflux pump subunit AcrA (membrane-fusion protein)
MARRPAITTIALGALAAAAVVVAILAIGSPSTSTAQERTVTVARGVVQSTVSGSGNLSPANQLELNFGTSGEVTHIYVKAGDHVSKDQVLAKLDDSAAKVDVAEAQATLQSAQDTLDEVQSQGSTTASSTSTSSSTASTASVSHAVMARTAQSSGGSGSGSGSESGSGSSSESGASGSGSSGSGSSGASGSGSGGGSTISEAAAEADVESAELAVTSAEKALAATTLRAPMAGTIAAIDGDVGSTVGSGSGSDSSSASNGSSASDGASVAGGLGGSGSSGSSDSSGSSSGFITLAQITRFKMDVSLSESDIGSVKVGQPATVTVNAASGEEFAARVTHIGVLSSSSGSSSSAVSYPVTLTLDQTSKHLKAGMSATADIVTSQVSGIAIPSQALSGSTVTVEDKAGKQSTRQVQTGVVGDSITQIVSGLSVGDTVVVRSSSAAAGTSGAGANQINDALRNRLGGGGGLGGGGRGLGGGGGGLARGAGAGPAVSGGP